MLEAKFSEAGTLKNLLGGVLHTSLCTEILTAINDLVTEANFNCNEEGIVLQAMDDLHVALPSLIGSS